MVQHDLAPSGGAPMEPFRSKRERGLTKGKVNGIDPTAEDRKKLQAGAR
jgi:hypothetical protein